MDYNVPDKIDGETWSASDHNSLKASNNSKQDKSSMAQDLATPSNSTYPSTSAIVTALNLPQDFRFRVVLTGLEDPSTKQESGYYILPVGAPPAIGYYPDPDPAYSHGGELIVYKQGSLINQILVYNANNTTHPPSMWRRTSNDGGATFEGWYQFPSLALTNTLYQPIQPPDGTPTINAPCAFTALGATDTKGQITLTNDTGSDILPGYNLMITFQISRPNVKVLLCQALFGGAISDVKPYHLTPTAAYIRLNETLPNGGSVSINYLIL
jgi:hypothetical protein